MNTTPTRRRYAVDIESLTGDGTRMRLVVAAASAAGAAEMAIGITELRRGGRFGEVRTRRLVLRGPVDIA